MRNHTTKVIVLAPLASLAMTAMAYAGDGGNDVGSIGVILRAITHIVSQLSAMF